MSADTDRRRNFTYEDVNIRAAETIASVSARAGVQRFVQVSHLNAAHNSTSAFYRTKRAGEDAVRSVFPNATIVRPAAMYGWEDKLLNKLYRTQTALKHNERYLTSSCNRLAHLVQAQRRRDSCSPRPRTER